MKKVLFLFLIYACPTDLSSQKTVPKLPDSLRNRSYKYMLDQVNRNETDTVTALIYLNAWVQKAKQQKQPKETAEAYKTMLFFLPDSLKLQYADSLISIAKSSKNGVLIGEAYMVKGALYSRELQLVKALDSYLMSARYTDSTDNTAIKFGNKLSISVVKYQLGYYEESLSLSEECVRFFSKNQDIEEGSAYLLALYMAAMSNTRLGRYSESTRINKEGSRVVQKLDYPYFSHYFHYGEAQNLYYRKDYNGALALLNRVVADPYLQQDKIKIAVSNMYIGRCFWDMGDRDKALPYFLKAERDAVAHKAGRLDLLPVYDYLVKYYKEKGDDKNQLKYIRRLVKADSIIDADYKYMSARIHKEYDTKELRSAAKHLEKELSASDRHIKLLWILAACLLFAVLFLAFIYYKKDKVYRQRFISIINLQEPFAAKTPTPLKDAKPDISPSVVDAILADLEKFEMNRGFLMADLTLVNLAALLQTNANYLSKVINYYKGKPYNVYLNELRINFCIHLLKNNSKFRHYNIKALAKECGFNTAQHFSKAFYASTGLYPSFFLSELNKKSKPGTIESP